MRALELKLLGRFECLSGQGEPISLPMRKAEVLLAFLALSPGLRHPRERLINLLWSDRGDEQARNSLRQCLSSIRKALGDSADLALQVDRSSVCLQAPMIEVDALEFERLALEGDFESLATASDLYEGEFLEGVSIRDPACQDWLEGERERFKRQYIEILINLAETRLVSHDYKAAIRTAERLVDQDPLGESGWRLLMKSYDGSGERNRALLAYKRCAEVLKNELGVEPDAETTRLQQSIAQQRAALSPQNQTESKPAPIRTESAATATPAPGIHNILVLPLKNLSGDPEQTYFSDGLTESIITGLSRFPSLRPHSRHTSFAIREQNLSISEIGRQFDARYIVEGSVRRSQTDLRISATLVDTRSGEQLWGDRFDRRLEQTFALEDELTLAIVAAVKGKIDVAGEKVARQKPLTDIGSYDLLLRARHHLNLFNPHDINEGIRLLEQYLEAEPEDAIAYNHLYQAYMTIWLLGWRAPRSKMLDKTGECVSRALELMPDNALIQADYGEYLVFSKRYDDALTYLERAISLNPNDPETLITAAGSLMAIDRADKAVELVETCYALDPYHPWLNWISGAVYFGLRRYQDALRAFKAMPNPTDDIDGWIAACHHRLGDTGTALEYLRRFRETALRNMAEFPETEGQWREHIEIWGAYYMVDSGVDDALRALQDLGLHHLTAQPGGNVVTDQQQSIVVLPFDNLSGDPEQEYFSDGITDSIIMNLALFPGLAVKSRNSSFAFKEQIKSLGEISRELDVDYLVEGSVRRSKDRIRINVQLIEARSGNQVWGRRYDSGIEDLFELEEDLSRSIAATVPGQIETDLQRIAITKGASEQKAYDLLLAGIHHAWQTNSEDNRIAIEKLNACLALDPDNARAHSYLYECHDFSVMDRWSDDIENSRVLAEKHIKRAMKLAPDDPDVALNYADYLTFRQRYDESEAALSRILEKNPNDADALAQLAVNLSSRGRWVEALEKADLALRLDPFNYWAKWIRAEALFFCARYEECLKLIAKTEHAPGFIRIYNIAANVELGRQEAAEEALQQFLEFCRENMRSMPSDLDDWWRYYRDNAPFHDAQINRRIIDLLIDAGLKTGIPAISGHSPDEPGRIHSIAVLPFDNLSGDPEQEYFSDGITESIILNLSLFPGLKVKSRNSSFAFKQQIKSLGEISDALEVDYLVEGSIRKSTDRIRITVQLIEASSGDQIWGKRYDSGLDHLFDLEEELSRTIAATVTGQIGSDLERIALSKGASHQQAYGLLLAGNFYMKKANGPDTLTAIDYYERCLKLDPDNAHAHAALYYCHAMNWMERWIEDYPSAFERAAEHAQKAVRLAPDYGYAQVAFAEYQIFCRNFDSAAKHLDKALAINPNDTDALTTQAMNFEMQGEFEKARQIAELSFQLDPYHPWTDWILAESHFFCERFEDTLEIIANSGNAPGFIRLYNVAANVRLGRMDGARKALKTFLDECRSGMLAMPQTLDEWMAYTLDNAPFADSNLNQRIIDCLVEAGLEEALPAAPEGEAGRGQPSVLVLPLENMSGDPEQDYFSNGITESLITTLSSSRGIAVKSRHTSFAYRDSTQSISDIGAELDVDYIVEGSIRKKGDQVRIAVQLGEVESGNQIWGKRYDKPVDELFDLEEELVRSLAGAISGRIGREVRILSSKKPAADMKSFDYMMRAWHYYEQHTPSALAKAIDYQKKAIEADPLNVEAHAFLAGVMEDLLYENWCEDRARVESEIEAYLTKALALDQNSAAVHAIFADFSSLQGDGEKQRYHADRAIELDPTWPDGYSYKAHWLAKYGDIEEAVKMADYSMQLDPYHDYVGWAAGEVYRCAGDYQRAIEAFRTMPVVPPNLLPQIAACLIALGQTDRARDEMSHYLRKAREFMPRIPATKNEWREYFRYILAYRDDDDFDAYFDLLVRAGLYDDLEPDSAELPSIAVLPFANLSGDAEQDYFSDGITSGVTLALGHFDGLVVKSQQTSFAFRASNLSSSEIAAKIDADYLVEGSIRKSAQRIRLNVQLIDARTGSQIWGQQYDEELQDILTLEEKLSQALASTIRGRLGHRIQQSAARKPAKDLKSYDHLMRGLYHFGKFTAKDMALAREEIEKCLAGDPGNVQAHTNLAEAFVLELLENWTEDRSLAEQKAQHHFETALELDPDSSLAHAYYADFLHIRGDYDQARFHADRAIEINPNSSEGHAARTDLLSTEGRHEEAVRSADTCLQLDPYSVGSGWVAGAAYRNAGRYQEAITIFRRIPHPPPTINAYISACFTAMGLVEEARTEMKRFLQLAKRQMSPLPAGLDAWREHWRTISVFFHDEDFEEFFSQLIDAGLCDEVDGEGNELPSIAVLPFENMSGDPEQQYFADGITADLIETLSKFRHLRTVSRYSTLPYKTSKPSLAEITERQQVRYILEGSVRRSGERIRVSAELIDSQNSEAVWSERFDRDLDDLFQVQDELTQSIALAMKVHLDDGDMARLRSKGTSNVRAWELIMTAVDLQDTYIRQNILDARGMAEEAIELDPDYPYAWICLGWTYWQEVYSGSGKSIEDLLAKAEKANDEAHDLDPDYAEVWSQRGMIHLMRHEPEAAIDDCLRAVELEPGSAEIQGLTAFAHVFASDYESARKYNQNMLRLSPIRANWNYLIEAQIESETGNLERGAEVYRQGLEVEPDSPLCRYFLIDLMMQLGDEPAARQYADEIRALDQSVSARGVAHTYSADPKLREAFTERLARFDLI